MTVHTFDTMGTVASLRTREPLSAERLAAVEGVFRRYDRTYSLYDPVSDLSRIARGELRLVASSPEVRDTYALALSWRDDTGGLFTPHRPDGIIDLSGVVKALAIDEAGRILDSELDDWLLTVGGDMLGRCPSGSPGWNVGVIDPDDRERLLGVTTIGEHRAALATSGTAERGDHIWSRHGRPHFVQASVAAADIITADVLATAIISGACGDLDDLTARWDIDVVTVDRDGRRRATPGARAWMRAPRRVTVSLVPGS